MALERSKKNITAKTDSNTHLVNSKTPYEILITEKAAQLPIPDMADAIWARVEAGLDAAAAQEHTDGSPRQKVRSRSVHRGSLRNGIIITAAAVITVIAVWLIKKRKKNPGNNKAIPAINETRKENVIADSNTIELPPLKNPPLPLKKDSKIIDGPGIKRIDSLNVVNSTIFQQQPAVTRNDSLIIPSSQPGPVIDASKTALPPADKPRGVKGISDSDYKIIMTKKDSANRKN